MRRGQRVSIIAAMVLSVISWTAAVGFHRASKAIPVVLRPEVVEVVHQHDLVEEKTTMAAPPGSAVAPTLPVSGPMIYDAKLERAKAKLAHEQRQALLLQDPELQRLFAERERANCALDFALLFRRLGLTAEESSRLVDAKVKWVMTMQDLKAIKLRDQLDGDDPALVAIRQPAGEALTATVEEILGADGVSVMQGHSATEGARAYLAEMGGALSRVGLEMTLAQVDGVLGAIAEISGRPSPNVRSFTERQWEELAEKTVPILTPAQWAYFNEATLLSWPSRTSVRFDRILKEAIASDRANESKKSP